MTSHLMGLFYRTLRMIDNGLKPVYVFDGKPPELKAGIVSLHLPVQCKLKLISPV
jgi:flap endonuclease-1